MQMDNKVHWKTKQKRHHQVTQDVHVSGVGIKYVALQDDSIAPAEMSATGQDASQALVDKAKGTCNALQVKKVLPVKHSLNKWKELIMPYEYDQDIDALLATPFGGYIGNVFFW